MGRKAGNAAEAYKKKVEKLRRTLPELYTRVAEKMQEEMLAETKERTPQDSGHLRDLWQPMPVTKIGNRYIITITNNASSESRGMRTCYAALVEFGYMQRPGMILEMREEGGRLRFKQFLGYASRYGLGEPQGDVPPDKDGFITIVTRKRFIKGQFMARDALEVMKGRWANSYRKRILERIRRVLG